MNRLLFFFACSLLTAPFTWAAEKPKPNVLFIAIDDLRDWVGFLGKNAQTVTPNLDKFAAKAEYFTHAYCAAPVCNPSRTALMSGLRPGTTGVYGNNDDWRPIVPEDKVLTHPFRANGYYVCGAGKIYHESYKRREDWDHYFDEKRFKAPKATGDTGVGGIEFAPLDCEDKDLPDYHIVNYGIAELGKKHHQPFFLAVGVHKPHMPWNVPRKYYDMHPLEQIILPPIKEHDLDDVPAAGVQMAHAQGDHEKIIASGRWKDAVQGYLAAISYCDAQLGRLLDAYEKAPDKANTLICLWSDHGWHLGEKEHWRKFALWEEATRAPVIWYVPGLTKPSVCDRTIDHMHIYPTLMELCGFPIPAHVEGKSILPLLTDAKAEWTTPAVTTHTLNNHAVRTEDFRLIRYADGGEELYDEKRDPNEWTNLANSTEFFAKKDELAKWFPTVNNRKPPRKKGKKESEDN